jgi:hypothetical protein
MGTVLQDGSRGDEEADEQAKEQIVAVIKIDGDASGALRSISQIENALGGIQKSVSAATRSLDPPGLCCHLAPLAWA